ncbi:hypothetical protein [Clostridium minihomine]|uniref:hypothetical protein n=1 Tax=Clostridium minihomine TaxID=2045012 RepID=UPI000C782CA9|nr:hypothetical protein [Clostridium minihomine]
MLGKMIRINFKLMIKQREFFIALLISFLFFLVPTILDLLKLFRQDTVTIAPAWCYFGVVNAIANSFLASSVQIYFLFFFPFIVSMAFASSAFDEKKAGTTKFIIQRSGRRNYYIAKAIVVFTGGFLIVFLSSQLSELALMLAIPLQSNKVTPYYPLEPDLIYRNVTFFQNFCYSHPYLYYFIYNIIGGVIGGLIGLVSYSISLHMKANRFLIITIPGILYLAAGLIFNTLGLHAMAPENLVVPPIQTQGVKLIYFIILIGCLSAIPVIALFRKIHIKKDEL